MAMEMLVQEVMTGPLKNIRHELFVREYIKNGGVGSDAYKVVVKRYPRKKTGMNNPNGYRVVACILRQRPEIRRREQELRETMAKRSDITMDKILTDYQEALILAKQQAKPNEIVNAATAQAKLVGLLRERFEHGDVGDFENMDNISDILTAVKDRAGAEAALALAKAFGLGDADMANVEPSNEEADGLIDQPPPSDSVN